MATNNDYDVKDFISNYYKKKLIVMNAIKGFFPNKIEFVVDFDKNKSFLVNDELKPNVEYLLGYRVNGGYGIIGLRKSAYGYYYPLTTLYYDKESLKELLEYQTLLLPVYTTTLNDQKEEINVTLYDKDKIKKLKKYRTVFEHKYKCVTNLTYEYIRTLEDTASNLEKAEEQKKIIKQDNYNLQMSNIKLETENERLKKVIKELRRKLASAKHTGDKKYEKLRQDIFDDDDEFIEDEIIDRAFKAFTVIERNYLEYYFGLNGKDKKTCKEIASIYEIASIQYTLNKLKTEFRILCLELKNKNPYIELLTDRQKLLSLAFSLSKEERDAFILKNGLYDCHRANNREISEKLGIPYVKVKKIVDSAEERVREFVKR